jgi:hypothetical protein
MSQVAFTTILAVAGFLAGLSWSAVTTASFNIVRRVLRYSENPDRAIGWKDLIGHLVGVVASGGYLLVLIFIAVSWTDRYPEWRANKDVFWFGLIAGVVLLQVILRRPPR